MKTRKQKSFEDKGSLTGRPAFPIGPKGPESPRIPTGPCYGSSSV